MIVIPSTEAIYKSNCLSIPQQKQYLNPNVCQSLNSRVGHPFFSKECNILMFFYVLCKRMQRSLRSFTFFVKECSVLCILLRSLKKKMRRSLRSFKFFIKEHCTLFGFISHTQIANLAKKRT